MPDYVPAPDGDKRARSAASVRLHAGGSQADHGAHGGERRRGHRLDGRRHPAGGALRPAAPALRLLPPALRAGHQPAHRPDPRGDGDVHGELHRPAANILASTRAGPTCGSPSTSRSSPSRTWRRWSTRGADPRALPLRGALHVLPGGVGRRGHGGGARQALRRRGERGAEGRGQHHHPLRPHRRRGRRSPSPRCSPRATYTSTWCGPGSARGPGSSWRRLERARCTTSRCSRATAPRPSTPTWPSPASPSSATS